MIFMLRYNNKLSYKEIATILNERGIATTRDCKWYACSVRYVIKNKIYEGYYTYKGNTVETPDLALL